MFCPTICSNFYCAHDQKHVDGWITSLHSYAHPTLWGQEIRKLKCAQVCPVLPRFAQLCPGLPSFVQLCPALHFSYSLQDIALTFCFEYSLPYPVSYDMYSHDLRYSLHSVSYKTYIETIFRLLTNKVKSNKIILINAFKIDRNFG